MARRGIVAAGVGAALIGGAAVGFLAERAIVRGRIVPPSVPAEVPLGSIEGELSHVDGPDGMRVAVETYGPEGAPQLVLAHGWICTARAWHEVVRRLADQYRIITYDQPGHGRTGSPASGHYHIDLLGDTLTEVIRTQAGPGPLVVCGHSMGGMSLLNAARREPDLVQRRLAGAVLLSTTSKAKGERFGFELGIRSAARLERGIRRVVPTLRDPRVVTAADRLTASTSDLSYLIARWSGVGPDADPEVVAFTQEMALSSGSDVVFGLLETVLGVDEDAGLDALSGVPMTLLVGEQDRITPRALTQRMAVRSSARLQEIPGVGHMSPLEAGDVVTDVLVEHLAGRVPRAADPTPTDRDSASA